MAVINDSSCPDLIRTSAWNESDAAVLAEADGRVKPGHDAERGVRVNRRWYYPAGKYPAHTGEGRCPWLEWVPACAGMETYSVFAHSLKVSIWGTNRSNEDCRVQLG